MPRRKLASGDEVRFDFVPDPFEKSEQESRLADFLSEPISRKRSRSTSQSVSGSNLSTPGDRDRTEPGIAARRSRAQQSRDLKEELRSSSSEEILIADLANKNSYARAPASVPAPARPRHARGEDFEVVEMLESGDWSAATTQHWVSSYVVRHVRVYGFAPEEAKRATWRKRAGFMASRVLRESFAGDVEQMADFCWWVWERERKLELYWGERRRQGLAAGEPRRLEVGAQFCDRMVSRYKFARMREPDAERA